MRSKKYALLYLNEIKYDDLAWEFAIREMDAEILDSGVSIYSNSLKDAAHIRRLLEENGIELVFTTDYSPAASMACHELGIKYVSWIYDAPQEGLFDPSVSNDCNYIFSFDRRQVEEIRLRGAKNIYHLPLATNTYRNLRLVINSEDETRFGCNVSFVGNMYSQNLYKAAMSRVSDGSAKEIESIVEAAFGIWDGTDRIFGKLSEKALDELWAMVKDTLPKDYHVDKDTYFAQGLTAKYLTHKERCSIVEDLTEYGIRLFTGDKEVVIPKAFMGGELSYDKELPKVYFLSKINLNVTLHCITSGIPLRVFDIMGVGGFMLTNFQPEIEEFFDIGKNIEVYHSIEECKDKVDYYLKHDEVRQRIALNGYELVSREHNTHKRLDYMLDKIGD